LNEPIRRASLQGSHDVPGPATSATAVRRSVFAGTGGRGSIACPTSDHVSIRTQLSLTTAGRTPPDSGGFATRPPEPRDFIRAIVAEDVKAGKNGGRVVTRFPPEPNGYMHIGHAASVCLNFGIAEESGGVCHLRFDDTNPETEDIRFVEAMIEDVRWLGFEWGEHLYFASDYFQRMYDFAEHLIGEGKAYVDSLSEEEIRDYRGTVTEPGRPSPYRERSVEENLDLFRRMQAGEFPDGAHVLRGKLDLASPNMRLRDPIFYRIRHAHHYRTGDRWRIYPMYDYAHPIEDAIECVTHSICTLEFENSRPIYDWIVANIPLECTPRQYEFARRNLDFTVMSKRMLLQLVRDGHVAGWDDPRMPTIAGLRRRGFTPGSIRTFAELAGVGKMDNRVDIGKLEFAIRDELNREAKRVLCVLDPVRVVITNYPEGETEMLDAPYFPRDVPREGSRSVPFSRVVYIDRDDFDENPPPGYHRLAPGREVRLRYAYVIRCDEVIRDEMGAIVELRCTYDPSSRGGAKVSGRSVKGTVHWVSADQSLPCAVRLYDRLFTVPNPDEGEEEFTSYLNPESLVVATGARIEPSVADDPRETHYQFERLGYFWRDPVDSVAGALVFNRTVTLRDTWSSRVQEQPLASELAGGGASAPEAGGRLAVDGGRTTRARRSAEPSTPAGKSTEDGGSGPASAEIADAGAPPVEALRTPGLDARRRRYVSELGVGEAEAEIITRDEGTADSFEGSLEAGASARGAANWLVHELPREAGGRSLGELPLSPLGLGRLVALVESGVISSNAGREVLAELIREGGDPEAIVEREGLRQISDVDALAPIVDDIIARNAAKAEEYRAGRTGLLGLFIGQVMKRTGGRANPEVVRELVEQRLA
jgi:glutaminyl-tRNA synthetase